MLFVLCHFYVHANSEHLSTIGNRLVEMGFEGVTIETAERVLYIEYENRVFLNHVYAAGVVLSVAIKEIEAPTTLVLVPRIHGVKIGFLKVESAKFQDFINRELSARELAATIIWEDAGQKREGAIRSYKRSPKVPQIDISFSPSVVIQLGNYDDPYKFTWNIESATDIRLWRGAQFFSNVTIPVFDEISTYTMEPRLSRFSLNQFFRLYQTTWGAFSAGIFYPDRLWLAVQIGGFWNHRRLFWGTQIEYTGFCLHQNHIIHYSKLNVTTGKLFCNYYTPFCNLKLGGGYAKYLDGDYGPFFEVSRKFGDMDIGFLVASTNVDQFARILLNMPIPPSKRFRPRTLRINWPFYYPFVFQGTSQTQTQGEPLQTGRRVQTRFDICDVLEDFLKNDLVLWRKAFADLSEKNKF